MDESWIKKDPNVGAAVRQFEIPGEFISAERYGSGHINDTYRITFNEGLVSTSYILQRVNHNVFKHPLILIENI